jgi:hypothetical protein
VNCRCQMGIQAALADIARNAVTEDSFKLMDGLGQLLEGQAKYDKALTWYEKAFAGFVGKGEEENTATTYGDNKLLLLSYINSILAVIYL